MIDVSPELQAFLKEEYDRCEDQTLEDERSTAIKRYNGQPYGDEEDGRSQVVARDTAETTDYMVISILRTIVSGDRVVEFVHKNSEAAHQATETIMHLLMDEQDGYQILHDWLKAGLLEKNAVAMTYPEQRQPKRRMQENVSALAMMAAEQQGIKIIEAEEIGQEGEEGPLFNVTLLEEQGPKFCDHAVPNEEFYASPDGRTLTECLLKGRKTRRTISSLVAEGIPEDELTGLGAEAYCDNLLALTRDEDRYNDDGARRGTARMVWWHEDYVTFDANGDGIAELLYIRRTGDFKVFSVDEMEDADDHPFEDWCPFPMQHRRIGQSLADKVMDIERIRTVLYRQSLDGIYLGNNPVTYLHEDMIGENTIEDILTVRPGAIRRYAGPHGPPVDRTPGFDPGAGFTMLEFMNGERESRTGITRLNQGLDADALNKTATGTALMQAQGQQVEEYLARNFANALARLFTKKAKLLKRYGQPIMVPIDGEYTEVDPTQWPEDMIARPRVGLGSGRKEQRIAFRRELIGYQTAALEAGLGIVDDQTFFNSAKGFVNDAGLGDVGEFFNDPSKPPLDPNTGQPVQKPEKPDPEMAKVQGEMQMKQAELQAKQQEKALDLQLRQQDAAAKLELEQQKAAAGIQAQREKAALDLQLARDKATAEIQLAHAKMQAEIQLERERMAIQRETERERMATDAELSRNRPGGDLDK